MNIFQDGDVQELRSTLRMSLATYHNLLEELRPGITKQHTTFRPPIDAESRLLLTLRFMALGDCFQSLSQQFRVAVSTARGIVLETCMAITSILGHQYLVTPSTRDEWIRVALEFENRWNFPNVIGCVDGKHIRLSQPRKSGTFYFNYKDFYSIVLLAIASADYRFLFVDIGSEGKASDGGIWGKSVFNEMMHAEDNPLNIPQSHRINGINEEMPLFLIGDDAFPLGPNLLKPFPGVNLTRKQEIYNYRLSRCRRVVENVFGLLTARFRVFQRTLESQPPFVEQLVMAACVLHNYLRHNARNEYTPTGTFDQELDDGCIIPGTWRQEAALPSVRRDGQRNASVYAKRVRQTMADYFLSKEGEVPWQYTK